ncbi:hypothetical protein BU17DRAFT_71299 [Hysterangium stoloniferum]|nr:hypothetical protein BU17DRAFT_71299 [Hysterangium stoloniferum]
MHSMTLEFRSLLRGMLEIQTASLSDITSSAETSLTLGIQAMEDVARTRIIGFLDTVSTGEIQLRHLKQGLTAVTETMFDVVELAVQTANQSNLAIERSLIQQDLQRQAIDTVGDLINSVTSLSSFAHAEIQRFNESAQELHARDSSSFHVIISRIKYLTHVVLRINPSSFDSLYRLPALYLFIRLLHVLWPIFKFLFTITAVGNPNIVSKRQFSKTFLYVSHRQIQYRKVTDIWPDTFVSNSRPIIRYLSHIFTQRLAYESLFTSASHVAEFRQQCDKGALMKREIPEPALEWLPGTECTW